MIAHLVLLQPRPELTLAQRRDGVAALTRAAAGLADVRRFRIGRRVKHGRPGYERSMTVDYEYLLLFEFDDVDALTRYLAAPAHGVLGEMFSTATSAALAYDYELVDAEEAGRFL